jgi:hypothetical protein
LPKVKYEFSLSSSESGKIHNLTYLHRDTGMKKGVWRELFVNLLI